MFNAALETGYPTLVVRPDPRIMSVAASPVVSVMTRLVEPARRSGKNALVENATPTTLVRNCEKWTR